MATELVVREEASVVALPERPSSGLALSFAEMTMRVAQLDQFYREVMQEGTDYGKIPGTDKPTLYQPGAQLLDQIFGYAPTFEVMPTSVIDWQRPIPFFHYVICCRLVNRRSGEVVAEGIGSCNSYEDKYRWRTAKRTCPACKGETIIKGKQEFGGGWLCFKKNGGCGAKYRDGDAVIESQQAGHVENEDSASLENTVSKMAQKRAHIAATLNATGASRIFTQDIEDLPQFQAALTVEAISRPVAEAAPPTPPADDIDARLADNANARSMRAKREDDLRRGTRVAQELGIDVEVIDPATLGDDELRETVKALAEMVKATKAEMARQPAPGASDDDPEAPF